jgi:SAM-dependent methyltransferase
MGSINNFDRFLRHKCSLAKAHYYDKILGIETTGYYNTATEDISCYKDMAAYSPTPYGRLEKMIAYLKLTPNDVFVDLGCGEGRVVFFVALNRLKKVIGVELNKQLIDIAKKNLDNLKINRTPIEFINTDTADFDVKDCNIFFIFNSFGKLTMEKVINNIKDSLIINPRKIRIVYYSLAERHILDKQDWLVLEGRVEDNNCLVWRTHDRFFFSAMK